MYLLVGKPIFIFTLGIIFLIYFGYPSYINYLAQETLISESYVKFKTENPPAITIAVTKRTNYGLRHGWKDDSNNLFLYNGTMKTFCNSSYDFRESLQCIKDKTYKSSDVINEFESKQENLNVPSLWTENISNLYFGMVFTLAKHYRIDAHWSKSFSINLNNSLDYHIWIHDPQFFLTTANHEIIPHVHVKLEQAQNLCIAA